MGAKLRILVLLVLLVAGLAIGVGLVAVLAGTAAAWAFGLLVEFLETIPYR